MRAKVRTIGKRLGMKCRRCNNRYRMFNLKHWPERHRYGSVRKEYLSLQCITCWYIDCQYVEDVEFQKEYEKKWNRLQPADKVR